MRVILNSSYVCLMRAIPSCRNAVALTALLTAACAPAAVLPGGSSPTGIEASTLQEGVHPRNGSGGLLVMAHGGTPEWNAAVEAAVTPMDGLLPTEIAFGMADPRTLQAAADRLAARGVSTIGVVRLFMSGESFLAQTEFLFGKRDAPPETGMLGHRMVPGTELERLTLEADVAIDPEGFAESTDAGRILVDRARLMIAPSEEGAIVILAHGMGAEEANDRLLHHMSAGADRLRAEGYDHVVVATLREDWEESRAAAEKAVREEVAQLNAAGRSVVVLPYRLFGFGPYADVLSDLEYRAGDGFLPHAMVTDWIKARTLSVLCGEGLAPSFGRCPVRTALPSN